LGSSGVDLLRVASEVSDGVTTETATVFATAKGVENLRKKVEQFGAENMPDKEKDGVTVPGRPKNADLVQSLGAIVEAGLRALWRSPPDKFPTNAGSVHWEIWLEPDQAETFVARAVGHGVTIGADRLHFPEDTVVIGEATRDQLACAVRRLGAVRALAAPTVTADFFDELDIVEQASWVSDLAQRANWPDGADVGYLTLMDTGISRAHPLVQPCAGHRGPACRQSRLGRRRSKGTWYRTRRPRPVRRFDAPASRHASVHSRLSTGVSEADP